MFAAWLTWKATAGKQRHDFISKLLDECQELRNALTNKDSLILDLQVEVKKLQQEVHALRNQIDHLEANKIISNSDAILETLFTSMPKAAWIHDVGSNKWYCNDYYAKVFAIDRKDFWTPINCFQYYPPAIAAKFVANDMAVVEANCTQHFVEMFPEKIMLPTSQTNPATKWDVVKIPVRTEGHNYVIGFCTNEKHNNNIIDFYRA